MTAKKAAVPQQVALAAPIVLTTKRSLGTLVAQYRKALAALASGALGWAGTCWVPDGHVDRAEWYALAVIAAGVATITAVPNDPQPLKVLPPVDDDTGSTLADVLIFALIVLVVLVIVARFV